MAGKGDQKRRRLFRLWSDNPRCYWCQRSTVLIFRPPNPLAHELTQQRLPKLDHEATLDHLNDRVLHPNGRPRMPQGVETTVLACAKCNNARSNGTENSSLTALPKEEVWERCGSYPVGHPKNPKKRWTFSVCGCKRIVYAPTQEDAAKIAERYWGKEAIPVVA